jgi:hypothetical protein
LIKKEAPLKCKELIKKTSDEKRGTLKHKGLSKKTFVEKVAPLKCKLLIISRTKATQ